MNRSRKLWQADEFRKSRLHDQKGNLIAGAEALRLPKYLRMFVAQKRGRYPEMPWLSLTVTNRLDQLLQPSWSMIEFGSGMSTRWFAERVGALLSIESDPVWFERVKPTLPANVTYEFRESDDYSNLGELPDASIDFALVDGIDRAKCMAAVMSKVKAGGWILLDNSDKDMTIEDGDLRLAESVLLGGASATWYFTGIPAGLMQATQSLLARL